MVESKTARKRDKREAVIITATPKKKRKKIEVQLWFKTAFIEFNP